MAVGSMATASSRSLRREARSQAIRESLIHIHLDRIDDHAAIEALQDGMEKTLAEVRVVVHDWKAMLKRVDAVIHD